MVQQSKQEYLDAIGGRNRRVGKRAKARILDEFTNICSYSRKCAIAVLKRPRRQRATRRQDLTLFRRGYIYAGRTRSLGTS